MCTRQAPRGSILRVAAFLLILHLGNVAALAQVPDATIQRIAEITVQLSEIDYLRNENQIDGQERMGRRAPLEAELGTLYREVGDFSPEEQRNAQQRILGLIRARLSILEPQWQKAKEQRKTEREQRDKAAQAAVPAAARAALEPQRRRLILQQRRGRGEISLDEFSAEDKKALDDISAIRNKYVEDYGARWVGRFDTQLERLTQTIANNPEAKLPTSRGRDGGGATPVGDYQKDVARAAELWSKLDDLTNQLYAKKIDDPAYREASKNLEVDLFRLMGKWRNAGRGAAFERDYRASSVTLPLPPRPASWWDRFEFWFIVVLGVVMFVSIGGMAVARLLETPTPAEPRVSTIYGTAQFSPLVADVEDDDCLRKGVFLGKSSKPEWRGAPLEVPGAPICSTPENHTLIVASTRTGKGTRVIVPTLLRYAGSALVLDPKGENAAITARSRRDRLQQTVHILNPWNELGDTYSRLGFQPATFNPLDLLDRDDPNIVAIAQSFAEAICPVLSDRRDQFWQGSAASILTAVFLWLADQPGEQKTLARAREITSMSRQDFGVYLSGMAASKAFGGAIRENAAQFVGMPNETYGGVIGAVNQCMKFLSDPQIKRSTEKSSFSMSELAKSRTTVYLVVPTKRADTAKTWLHLVLAAGMHTFKSIPRKQRPGHRCLFLIDEFGTIGRLGDMPSDIATMAGYGLDIALVVQGLDQLRDLYGEARGTILSNCAYKYFCNITDLETAKWLSEALGKTTVTTTTTSESHSSGSKSSSDGVSTSHGETARWLLNPDEITRLGKSVAIALHPHGYPHYLRPVDYWRLEEAFAHLQPQHPGMYWDPPLTFDPNPFRGEPRRESGPRSESRRSEPKGESKKQDQSHRSPFGRNGMSADDARDILGVGPKATRDEILQAYRNLMAKVHPDHGGSKRLAQELNAAKAVLLGD
jgi:type IV secretion system protein VirD4